MTIKHWAEMGQEMQRRADSCHATAENFRFIGDIESASACESEAKEWEDVADGCAHHVQLLEVAKAAKI